MFKHVRNLPCRYRSQKKAWMDWTLFDEWLQELDRTFEMIVGNCPAHPEVSGLTAINLQLLSPNTTSCPQPVDQGDNQVCLLYYSLFLLTKSIESQSDVKILL